MAKQKREEFGVKPGDEIVIKGTVIFSRLDKLVEGQTLIDENVRRKARGMIQADTPFRSISIENPEVVVGQDTPLAKYHGQDVYTSAKGTPTMTLESKSKYPPSYGHKIDSENIQAMADPEKNPSIGQVVYLHIKTFQSKGYSNLGSTFNSIVFEEGPISFYEGSDAIIGFGTALGMNVIPAEKSAPATPNTFSTPAETTPAKEAPGFGVSDEKVGGFGGQGNPFDKTGNNGSTLA